MRKTLFATAIITALVTCSVPVTSHAANVTISEEGGGYIVIEGQECEDLQEILENIFANLSNGYIICPEIPSKPETETPEQPDIQEPTTSEQPDTEEPTTSEQPDTEEPTNPEQPDTQEPTTSEQPDTEEPAIPEQPDTQKPITPEQPDTEEPTIPEQPDTEEPDDGSSEDTVHPYASQVLNLVNRERAKAGLPALKLDADITAAANVRAREIKQSFSHTRPNGSSFSTVLKEQGVSFIGSGENIAWGQMSPEQVMDGWMNSDGHRANILNKNFKNIGIGYYQDANGRNYWVQLFTF